MQNSDKIKTVIKRGNNMEIKRKIYQKLIDWKNESQEHFLLLSGIRYVGKTYILKKFGQENFEHVTYINMAEFSEGRKLEDGTFKLSRILRLFARE